MATRKPKYYLVEADVLPEIFAKVMEAKELLDTGEVKTVGQAVAWTSAAARFINTRIPSAPFTTCARARSSPSAWSSRTSPAF